MIFSVPPANKVANQGGILPDLNSIYAAVQALSAGNVLNSAWSGGADPSGAADSTAAIQAALNAGLAYLPPGTYSCTGLTIPSGATLAGAGMNTSVLSMTSTTADALTMTDNRYITIRDLKLQGPGSGSGRGIGFISSAAALASLSLRNLRVTGFGSYGVYLDTPITSRLENIRVENCGNDYFYLQNGTSCVIDNCYANGATGTAVNGYQLHAMSYCTLNACAADSIAGSGPGGGAGYLINGGQAITLNSCGNEKSALGFKVTTAADSITFNGCEVYQETNTGLLVTGTSTNVTVNSFKERSPNGASVSVNIDTGCAAVVINPSVITAATYTSGTSYVVTKTGGVVH